MARGVAYRVASFEPMAPLASSSTTHPRPTATPDCLRLIKKALITAIILANTKHLPPARPSSRFLSRSGKNQTMNVARLTVSRLSRSLLTEVSPPTGLLFLSTPSATMPRYIAFSFPRPNHTLPPRLRSYPANRCQSEPPLPPPIFLLLPTYIVYPNTFLLPTSVVRAKHRSHLSLPSRGAGRCQVPYVKVFHLICAPIQPITRRPTQANTNSNSSC